jgi:hypothetical protein
MTWSNAERSSIARQWYGEESPASTITRPDALLLQHLASGIDSTIPAAIVTGVQELHDGSGVCATAEVSFLLEEWQMLNARTTSNHSFAMFLQLVDYLQIGWRAKTLRAVWYSTSTVIISVVLDLPYLRLTFVSLPYALYTKECPVSSPEIASQSDSPMGSPAAAASVT